MGLFDSIQDLIGGATSSASDVVGGLTDNQTVQDLQDQATNISDGATETVNSATEQGQTFVDDVTNNLGL